jgi:DNA-binding transcriptional LysR family regulator
VFLPRLIDRLRAAAPHAAIRSVSMPPQQIARGLESGEIDLAVGYFLDLVQGNFFQPREQHSLRLMSIWARRHALLSTSYCTLTPLTAQD